MRDARFVELVREVTASDPAFIAGADVDAGTVGLAQYLRETMLMRSAAVVMAAEYVAAGGAGGRGVVARVLRRADEPAEMLGYWFTNHGRNLPMPIKRGVADAVRRLYTERAALRYDGLGRQIRMADVIELTHPSPRDQAQSALFAYLLDRRHHDDAVADPAVLPTLAAAAALDAVPADERRSHLRRARRRPRSPPVASRGSGCRAGCRGAWTPRRGRRSSRRWGPWRWCGTCGTSIRPASARPPLTRSSRRSPTRDEVAAARLFPYQVWAAYRHAPSDTWKLALGRTLDHTVSNIPALDGTLVVIDTSGSMQAPVSNRSRLQRVEVAAVMAMATAARADDVDVVIYGADNARVHGLRGASVLSGVDKVVRAIGSVGHATYGHTAIARWFDPRRHRRAVIFTDDQQHDAGRVRLDHVPVVYTFDLAGYRPSALPAGERGRYTLGGFTDATFTAMDVLERGRNAGWPF